MSSPTVKATPTFKVGDRIACKSTGEEFLIERIDKKTGALACKGRVGLMPADAAEAPLTAAQKAELAAE